MTTHREDAAGDEFWRRPAEPQSPGPATTDPPAGGAGEPPPAYPGPPRAATPDPRWRPPTFVQPQPPRRLPAQDLDRLESDERGARTMTYGIGMLAGAVLLIVMGLLCARILF